MMKENLNESIRKESTISRQTRNAFLTAVVFAIAEIISFVISLQISLATRTIPAIGDTIVVFGFVILTIISANLIRNGKKEKGIWMLLSSFVLTLALRNALTNDLSIIFSILSISVISLIGLLTLKPALFNRVLGLAIASGAFYLVFDISVSRFLPDYRQLSENVPTMVNATSALAIIITSGFIITLFRQHRFLLLSSKLTLAMVFLVLIPLVVLSIAGSLSLENTLTPRQNEALQFKATLVAQSIDNFIGTNKRSIQADAQSPAIVDYLSYLDKYGNNPGKQILEKQALGSLNAFRQRDSFMIASFAILDINGQNILDTTSENIGKDEHENAYFTQTLENNLPFVSDLIRPKYSSEYSLYFSTPISLENGKIVGVIRAQYHPYILQEYINNYIEAENASNKEIFIALISEKEVKQISPEDPSSVYIIFANGRDPELNFMSVTPLTTNVITPLQMNRVLPVGSTAQLSLDLPGLDEGLRNTEKKPVFEAQAFPREQEAQEALDIIAVAKVEEELLSWNVVISQDLHSFRAPYNQQNEVNTIIAIIIAISTMFLAYTGSQYLTAPFLHLATIANQIASGDLDARVVTNTEDEIGMLGNAFNSMTSQLNTLITTLEDRVTERTQALERNAQQLRAVVTVGSTAASLRNLDELLSQATEEINEEFGFYHAGIFLIDTYGKFALLKAANSTGGRRMLAREHKLEVGAEGIVGYVTAEGKARIALDVGRDAAFFNNPDLPQTRSEMALPLIAGGKTLGALDIQSTEGEAFSQADIATLQILADQIAIAIENANLFEESRKSLSTVQRAYGEQSHLGWQELVHQKKNYGYRSRDDGSIYPLTERADESLQKAMQENKIILEESNLTTNIPIRVRGKSIGAIQLSKPNNARSWDQKDLDLAETLTAELSRAMDSARLFDETRQQADRERVVGEISDRMRETMNVESVVRLAADELYKLLDLEHITIHLNPDDIQEEDIA